MKIKLIATACLLAFLTGVHLAVRDVSLDDMDESDSLKSYRDKAYLN
jgi:hypothetical protein